ncbi:MAG: NAD(P)/FAD-dependent oxidoreductase, partial [Planctomycetota bacterium]
MDAPRRERDGAPALPSAVDVVVVGAGAAGLMAAIQAGRRGRRTLLLEKQQRPGLKILISGGGRCNLTTTRAGADLEAQYGAARGRFLRHALRAFPPTALRAFIEQAGVPLQEEDLDKLFPVSQKARDVVAHPHGGFTVSTDRGAVQAASVVLATGGLSYPKNGATGDGYPWCRALGHTVTATWPALAPLAVAEPWVRELQGIVLHGVALTSLDAARQPVTTRVRPILFTHKGLSGPAPMDLAGDVEQAQGAAAVRFDFAPDRREDELEAEWLALAAAHGGRRASSVLPAALPERVRAALCAQAGGDVPLANWPRPQRRALVAATKGLVVPVGRSLGYDHAEVTRGGVALAEIDASTMQSKVRPGLFVCGELLDV